MCGLVSLTPPSASAVPLARPRREMPPLFLDEPLSEALCKALADTFPSSLHVRLLGPGRAADAPVGAVARVAGARRREDLRHERRWADDRHEGGTGVRGARRKRFRRLHAQLAGDLGRTDLHSHGEISVLHREAVARAE